MMLRVVQAILIVAFLLGSSGAHAGLRLHGQPVNQACPFGADAGCAGANPNSIFQQSNFPSWARQSGQTWYADHPQTWNIAGADYPLGYDKTLTLNDPTSMGSGSGSINSGTGQLTFGSTPAITPTPGLDVYNAAGAKVGTLVSVTANPLVWNISGAVTTTTQTLWYGAFRCAYQPAGGPGGKPWVECSNSGSAVAPIIQGFDFSLHNCVPLDMINSPVSGTVTIVNNKFKRSGSGCDGFVLVTLNSPGNYPLLLKWNVFDGNYPAYSDPSFSALLADNRVGGAAVYQYNVWINASKRTVSGFYNGGLEASYNWWSNFGQVLDPATHIELNTAVVQAGFTAPKLNYLYNTAVITGGSLGSFSTMVYTSQAGSTLATVTEEKVIGNTFVTNCASNPCTTFLNSGAIFFGRVTAITNLTIATNFFDASGAHYCQYWGSAAAGPQATMSGTISHLGTEGTGFNTMNVTSISSGTIYPYSVPFNTGNETHAPIVQPYGTQGTTGLGGLGTYIVADTLQTVTMTNWSTTPAVQNFTYGTDNISLTTGTTASASGPLMNASGSCPGSR